jgi:hypothetical protein
MSNNNSHEHRDEDKLDNRSTLVRWWHKIILLAIAAPGVGVVIHLIYHPFALYFGLPCP